jgi:hypothetical protein
MKHIWQDLSRCTMQIKYVNFSHGALLKKQVLFLLGIKRATESSFPQSAAALYESSRVGQCDRPLHLGEVHG